LPSQKAAGIFLPEKGQMFESNRGVAPKRDFQWKGHAIFGLVCVLVIGFFAWSAQPVFLQLTEPRTEDSSYNLLVQGFRAGQLNLKKEAPVGLARLTDPCDPAVNAPYLKDVAGMSYYKGKLYLYFGVTPALVIFWPYAALTGHYLSDRNAVIIFFTLGFLAAAGLLRAVWRRCFPEVNTWVPAAGMLALGLALGTMIVVSPWSDVNEVAATCGFAFTMVAVAAIWCALQRTKWQVVWLLAASLAYGLAIGARPSLLFGVIIVLLPAIQTWCAATESGSRRRAVLLLAAAGPVMLVGLGLMLYNALRFDNPLEFGWHYQLQSAYRPGTAQQFGLHHLCFNFRHYFLEPMRWSGHFPFLQPVVPPALPPGYIEAGRSYGGIIPVTYPLVWLALAAPLAWRDRRLEVASGLRWFVAAVFLQFMVCAPTLCLFFSADSRYGLDFLPALMLLAVVGILGLERTLVSSPVWRHMARWGWCLLLAWSVVFNLLVSLEACAESNYFAGNLLVHQGRAKESVKFLQKALALEPESAAFHSNLGTAYYQTKRLDEAITQYQKALEIDPDFAEAAVVRNDLGLCLLQKGRVNEAITHFQKVLEIKPDYAEAHNNLGRSLFQAGRVNEAAAHFQRALQIKPDYAEAHNNLGYALHQTGRVDEAIVRYQRALEIEPDYAEAHNNLGVSLFKAGRVNEAIARFQRALEIKPDYAEAHNNLAYALRQTGRVDEAIVHYRKAVELQPQFTPALADLAWILATCPEPSVRNGSNAVVLAEQADRLSGNGNPNILHILAAAYAEVGRFPEAIATANRALALAKAQSDARLVILLQTEIGFYQINSPYRSANE
jgi:tetratricopeptide (TPR) repeat protein